MLIDTHTHLFDPEFDEDREEVIDRARKAGVASFFLPNIDVHSIEPLRRMVDAYSDCCYPMMGLHPTSVDADYRSALALIEKELDNHNDYIAVGEIGLDYYWSTDYKNEQIEAFTQQLVWARKRNLPVSVHCRNAWEDVYRILQKKEFTSLRGVLHSFTGTLEEAMEAMRLPGLMLGINGVVTFKNSKLPEVLVQVPLDRLILETDAPYLSPVPYRGRRNEPAYVACVADKLAMIYGKSVVAVETVTTDNARRLFGK